MRSKRKGIPAAALLAGGINGRASEEGAARRAAIRRAQSALCDCGHERRFHGSDWGNDVYVLDPSSCDIEDCDCAAFLGVVGA